MKRCLLPPLAALLLVSCGAPDTPPAQESVSIQVVKKTDGLTYALGSNIPFTGEVLTITHGNSRQSSETYVNGQPHGLWTRYWSNGGKPKRQQEWKNGEMIHQRQWFENGVLKEDMEMKQGILFGHVRLWWPNGRIRRIAFVGEKLSPHGHVLEYNEDGTVLVDAIFHRGQFVSGLRKEDSLAQPATAQAH